MKNRRNYYEKSIETAIYFLEEFIKLSKSLRNNYKYNSSLDIKSKIL